MADLDKPARKPPLIFRIFGWTFGTLSVLNLIQDLRVVQLRGLISEWTSAYAALVSPIGNFLFGWINWQWVKVELSEHHVLVVAVLLAGSIGRAGYATMLRRRKDGPGATAAGFALGVFLLALIAVLLLPTPWSLGAGLMLPLLGVLGSVTRDEGDEDPDVDLREFLKEVLVVGAVFLIIIVLNYVLFPPE